MMLLDPQGRTHTAQLSADYLSPNGPPVVLVAAVAFQRDALEGWALIDATPRERALLREAGYSLPQADSPSPAPGKRPQPRR